MDFDNVADQSVSFLELFGTTIHIYIVQHIAFALLPEDEETQSGQVKSGHPQHNKTRQDKLVLTYYTKLLASKCKQTTYTYKYDRQKYIIIYIPKTADLSNRGFWSMYIIFECM